MRGTAVRDPVLAAPAVELAKCLQQRPTPPAYFGHGRRRLAVAVVSGGVALVSLVMEHWFNALFFGLCVPCIVFAEELIWAPMRQKRADSIVANGG